MQHPTEYTVVAPMPQHLVYQSTPPQSMHSLQHQPLNQPIQTLHHPIPQSMNQPMNEYTCRCPGCQLLLSFPYGMSYICCPRCNVTFQPISFHQPQPQMQRIQQINQTMHQPIEQSISQSVNPPVNPPNIAYTTCPTCSTLLSHPTASTQIQCPSCQSIIQTQAAINQPIQTASPEQSNHTVHQPINPQLNQQHSQPTVRLSKDHDRERSSNQSNNQSKSQQPQPASLNDFQLDPHNKRRKDPNAPKRASNAYMIFCQERRPQLKNDRPDLPFGQLGKRLGEIWRSMSDKEKEVYEQRACGDRDRYKGEMTEYQSVEMMKNVASNGQSGENQSAAKATTPSAKRKRAPRPKKRVQSDESSQASSDHDEGSDHEQSSHSKRKRMSRRSSSSSQQSSQS